MYRDDVCAVCGESLPPDHFYCRTHAAEVDARLHEIAAHLEDLAERLPRLATLLTQIAPETWDWLADQADGTTADAELRWPPAPQVTLHTHADEIDVDVDVEPGRVRVDLGCELATLLAALSEGLARGQITRVAEVCGRVDGAGATH